MDLLDSWLPNTTRHARARMQQRGIAAARVDFLLDGSNLGQVLN